MLPRLQKIRLCWRANKVQKIHKLVGMLLAGLLSSEEEKKFALNGVSKIKCLKRRRQNGVSKFSIITTKVSRNKTSFKNRDRRDLKVKFDYVI